MFFVIVFSIWFFIHLYVGWRLIRPLHLEPPWSRIAWIGPLFLFILLPVMSAIRLMDPKPFFFIQMFWITFILAGFTMLVFPMLVAKDVVAMVLSIVARLKRTAGGENPGPAPNPSKRAFLANSVNAGILGFSGALGGVGIVQARQTPPVVDVAVPIRNLHPGLEGFKIAHLSDIHVSPTIRKDFIARIVDSTNRIGADFVSVTGDLADGLPEEMKEHIAPLAGLQARHGVFFATGNHEYYWDTIGWISALAGLGLKPLINENTIIDHGGAKVMVAGVTDYTAGRYVPSHASDPDKAVRGGDDADVKIMLAHQPRSAPAVSRTGAHLQLSGHTHGGQFFPWNFVVPLVHPVPPGLTFYRGMWVYVSRGTGYWGPPMRLMAPSEITKITLIPY